MSELPPKRETPSVNPNWFYGFFFLLGVVLIALSHGSGSEDHHGESFWMYLGKELGIALVIAMALVFTVERITRTRHEAAAQALMADINTDLFRAIYHRYIPDQVFAEVEKCLLGSMVLRSKYSLDYSLDLFDDGCGLSTEICNTHLKIAAHSKYTLENLAAQPIRHELEASLELPIDADEVKEMVTVNSVSVGGTVLTEEQMTAAIDRSESHVKFKHEIEIPANGSVDITMVSHTIKRKLDMEVWASRLPSNGLTLRITAPKSIEVHATANHSEKLAGPLEPSDYSKVWELNHGIFPFQSVIFWWNVK